MPRAVTKPITKKRGHRTTPEAKAERISKNRELALDTAKYSDAEQVDPNKPLTDKQKLFVKFWASGESPLSASYKAGYADGGTYAYRMVRMPNILALYNEEKRLYEESCQMTRKQVMEGLLESIEMAKLMAEPATMVSGWREIGKLCGYYEPVKKKVEVSITGAQQRLEKLTDAQLFELIQGTVTEVLTDETEESDE
jgi:hypothetical protein